jgi:chemotaxis protein MotB
MVEEDPPAGVPEWVVSFGDMMTLLMTFFIMLVSFSEPKKDEKFNALVEQLQRQFGKDISRISMTHGGVMARQASVAKGASQGRAKRQQAMQGGDKEPSVAGEFPRVRMVRPGTQTAVGTVIFFPEGSAELNEQARAELRHQGELFAGKPQKIEIRGHTSLRPTEQGSDSDDGWELAYARSRAVMRFLVDEMDIEAKRIRISVAGPNEPLHLGIDPAKMRENPRVELYLLEEVVNDLSGTAAEREQQYASPN